jgi:hypothetical protein
MIVVGLDLGQAADYTALSALEIVREQVEADSQGNPQFDTYYDVRHLQRFELNMSYPEIVKRVVKMLETPQLKDQYMLVPDATGVGRPVVDLFRGEKVRTTPVCITFGNHENYNIETGYWDVPKKELVSNLQVLFGNHRLRFANNLKDKDVVTKELINFKIKITKKGNDTYEAWREGDHDDLVLSIAIAAWYAKKFGGEKKIDPARQWKPALLGVKGL